MKKLSKLLVMLLALLMVFAMAACNNDGGDEGENDGPTEPKLNQGSADCSHVWGEWQEQTESTCTKKGTELKTCTLCGKEESRRIPATGHYFTEGVCAACGRQERACEHQTVEQVVIKEPTCTEPGQRNSICTICDAVIGTNQTYPTGHGQLTTIVEKEPTCTENGRAKEVCGVCGEVDNTYTIYSQGHTDTEWVTVTEPTCTENGYEQQICHTCEQVIDDYYSSYTGHDYNYTPAKTPTCTEDGWYEYRTCSICDDTNYEDKFRPATGHDHIAGLCTTCGATDPAFVKTDVADIPKLEHTISKPADAVFTAPEAQILTFNPSITVADEKTTYTFTATNSGLYYFWVSELYSGNSVNLYVKNYLGENETYKTNLQNNDGFYTTLSAGQEYRLVVVTRSCSNPGSFVLKVGCQTAKADVSAYTSISDSIAYKEQYNHYLFTPSVTGVYRFWFTDLYNNAEVDIYVYNDLNERVSYQTYCGNNEGVVLNMTAGKTYRIAVEYNNGKSVYTLHMGKQQAKVDVSAYNTIHDHIFYKDQANYYTFTVPADGSYRFQMADITNDGRVDLRLYNSLGEKVAGSSYGNGGGFTVNNLVAGETYTIVVEHNSGLFGYTLHIFCRKPVVELTDNTGAADSFEYGEQSNYYTFTATEGGTYRVAITGMNTNVDVCLYIYDANGQQIASDTYCYNGEYLTLSNLAPGATYTIRVYANGTLTDYIVSVQ